LATVRTVSKTNRVENTFNLEVADFHTYFVGELAVWVHNACAYTVPGSRTRSGQNYHGSTKEADPAQRSGNGRDGRRREPGDTTQQMPNSTRREREVQEQVQINADGGLGRVDNARNPVAPSKWKKYGIPPPR
jgi:hypothetical protein